MSEPSAPLRVSLSVGEVTMPKPARVKVHEQLTLAVCEVGGRFFALDSRCPHRGAALAEGEVKDGLLVCPLHHFKFNLETGRCLMPKHLRVQTFPVTREGDTLTIQLL